MRFAWRFHWPGKTNFYPHRSMLAKWCYVAKFIDFDDPFNSKVDIWLFCSILSGLHCQWNHLIIVCPQGGCSGQPAARDGGDDLVEHLPGALRLANPQHWTPFETLVCPLRLPLMSKLLFQITLVLIVVVVLLLPPFIVLVPLLPSPVATLVFLTPPKHKVSKPEKIDL